MTTKDKLIEKQKELILFYEKKLSVGEINSAYDYKKQMFLIESELAKEEPEGLTAEEILRKYMNKLPPEYVTYISQRELDRHKYTLEAMESYAKSKQINLRKELKNFNSWMCGKQYGGRIPLIGTCIDEYLQSKEK